MDCVIDLEGLKKYPPTPASNNRLMLLIIQSFYVLVTS